MENFKNPSEPCPQCQEMQDTFNRIMAEKCPPDEKHCTCVPILMQKMAETQRVNDEYKELLAEKDEQLRKVRELVEDFIVGTNLDRYNAKKIDDKLSEILEGK